MAFECAGVEETIEDAIECIDKGGTIVVVGTPFHAADLFFNPSLMEGFSQVNLQAMSSGLPCILTDAPGNRDAAVDGGAVVARAGDVASMADALTRMLEDPAVRARLAREAHQASKRYAWRRVAADYEAVFKELVANE